MSSGSSRNTGISLNHLPTVVTLLLETLQEGDIPYTTAWLFPILQCALEPHAESPRGGMLETAKVILAFMPEHLIKGDALQVIATMCCNGNK